MCLSGRILIVTFQSTHISSIYRLCDLWVSENYYSKCDSDQCNQYANLILRLKIRALYFAPLRSAYRRYCETPFIQLPESGRSSEELRAPWPQWAKAHSTPHTVVPGVKTPSSPKSLYRLADSKQISTLYNQCRPMHQSFMNDFWCTSFWWNQVLIIPELKAICYKQIINSLDMRYVISEINNSVFQQHEELRVEAYKFMRKNWRTLSSSELTSLLTQLSPEEAGLLVQHTLMDTSS